VDGVVGGNASVGVISADGLYTPPPAEGSHAITATSVADPSRIGSASVTVTFAAPATGVTVTPATASISTLQTQQFTATVLNNSNQAVTWRVDGIVGGNAGVGAISTGGLYSPPSSAGAHAVTATSVADPTQSGSASITVTLPPAIGVTVTPVTATISTLQTQQFTATVANNSNQAVTWRVDGIVGGNAGVGVISTGGRYTPPPSEGTHAVTATSVADPTQSGSASVTVTFPPGIRVTVTPATASISTLQEQQFTATVVNSNNQAVTWRVDGDRGGNSTVGRISDSGLYTPPNREGTHTITATSDADSTRVGSATVTVTLASAIGVTVAPATATISTLQTQQFTATVVNSSNQAVTWRVDGVAGGNASVGVISAGLYTPPLAEGTHAVTATSVADPTKSDSASVTVTLPPPAIAVTVTPATATISTLQTQQFTAAVVNGTNPAVTWQVDGIVGGNASVGVISAGLYTPPPGEATHSITATSVEDPSRSSSASVTVRLLSGVLTYHNDNARTGQNLQETVLTPANVNTATFGKLFSFAVDGAVYAQPLYVSNVPIAGQLRNVVFVATQHDSVYAFDADNNTNTPLWQKSFIDPANGITTVPSSDLPKDANLVACGDITPEVGITSTPVIDPATGTLYVVAKTRENGVHKYRLHALDITTGVDKSGAGVEIQASVPGTAQPNDGNGRVLFSAELENQRLALLLSNNVVYFGTSSYCDFGDHHGWFLAYDSKTLNLLTAFNATPTGTEGGIWQSGGGAAADASGNIYVTTADGTFDADQAGGINYGNTILKFAGASLAISDYFTPFNQAALEAVNADLGSAGVLLLPDQAVGLPHLLVGAGKQGIVYVLDRDNMGRFQASSDSQIVQSFPGTTCGTGSCPIFGTPAYFNNRVYIVIMQDRLKAYSLSNGTLRQPADSQSTNTFPFPGSTPAVSADGSNNGIVWALQNSGSGAAAVLRAYSAADVSIELYNSNQTAGRDVPGSSVKFSVPTIANGKVYVGTQNQLSVFGLLP
ncbi:MAG: hypothetical protein WBO23_12230, partial [Burkholderiales bacterium]